MGSLHEVTTGLFSGSISNPYDHSFPKTVGRGGQNCITNRGQTVPDTMVACTDSLWEHTIALSNQQYHRQPLRGTHFLKKLVVKKIKSKLLQNRNRYLKAMHK